MISDLIILETLVKTAGNFCEKEGDCVRKLRQGKHNLITSKRSGDRIFKTFEEAFTFVKTEKRSWATWENSQVSIRVELPEDFN